MEAEVAPMMLADQELATPEARKTTSSPLMATAILLLRSKWVGNSDWSATKTDCAEV